MNRYDGYACLKTEDELFDARDLLILVHASMDRQGYLLEGSKLQLACGGDEASLQVTARRQNSGMETVVFEDHQAIEEAIARSNAVGMVDVQLDQMFDDHRRSGSARIEEAAKHMRVPTAAFGLDGLPDDTNRLEGIVDALAYMAAHRIIPGPEHEDNRWISASYKGGHAYASLVGSAENGEASRLILLDEEHGLPKDPELAEVGRAMRACIIGDGYGRKYDASIGRTDHVIIDAALVLGQFESPDHAQVEKGFAQLRRAVDAALAPRQADVAVERVVAPQPDVAGGAKIARAATMHAMFTAAARSR